MPTILTADPISNLTADLTLRRELKVENRREDENVVSIQIKPAEAMDKRRETKEKQARSFLRNEFLGVLFTITNQPVKIQFDKTRAPLDATFAGSDFTFSTISVRDLKTSIGVEPHSLLRTSDIASITYQL